jgi:hypothetical protein
MTARGTAAAIAALKNGCILLLLAGTAGLPNPENGISERRVSMAPLEAGYLIPL